MRPYLHKTHHKKKAGGVAQGVDHEFKFQYYKDKFKRRGQQRAKSGGGSLFQGAFVNYKGKWQGKIWVVFAEWFRVIDSFV
jgi:hypothetical protein